MKFCLLFNLSPCARYCLLIGSQLTTWSQGNLHYIRLHFFQASFPVVLGDFGCDVTCQACRENSPRTPPRYRARFLASSGNSDSANRPGYEADFFQLDRDFFCLLPSLARLYSAAASPSERLRSDGSLAIKQKGLYQNKITLSLASIYNCKMAY